MPAAQLLFGHDLLHFPLNGILTKRSIEEWNRSVSSRVFTVRAEHGIAADMGLEPGDEALGAAIRQHVSAAGASAIDNSQDRTWYFEVPTGRLSPRRWQSRQRGRSGLGKRAGSRW